MIVTTEAHELALFVINDGAGYRARCETARRMSRDLSRIAAPSLALAWVEYARQGAHDYYAAFCTAGDPRCFTASDILAAAYELSVYYVDHIKEVDNG